MGYLLGAGGTHGVRKAGEMRLGEHLKFGFGNIPSYEECDICLTSGERSGLGRDIRETPR